LSVICELLGLPRADRPRFIAWANSLTRLTGMVSFLRMIAGIRPMKRYLEGRLRPAWLARWCDPAAYDMFESAAQWFELLLTCILECEVELVANLLIGSFASYTKTRAVTQHAAGSSVGGRVGGPLADHWHPHLQRKPGEQSRVAIEGGAGRDREGLHTRCAHCSASANRG
jgi:hypothetical protein